MNRCVCLLIGGILLCAALVGVPCGALAQEQSAVRVYAAASLKNAFDELTQHYQAHGGDKTVVSYAASSALARQIENGAPADIFVSADLDWMNYVEQRNLLRIGTRVNLVRNEIVLIASADNRSSLVIGPRFPLATLLGGRRLAMADPDHVPAGKYGKAALAALEVWPSVSRKIARGENVRAALQFVSRGEAPFGIVYRTDAMADRKVRIVGVFPADSHPPIVYPAAILAGSSSPGAEKFFVFLKSSEAANVFRKHGFVIDERA
jgi:molybdate transport system substrate-binding protein